MDFFSTLSSLTTQNVSLLDLIFLTHSFITETRCLSLLLFVVSFEWFIEEHYVHHWYTMSFTQQSLGKWRAVHEERRQFVLSASACFWEYGCDRRGWNVLCLNMLYFPTVSRTESLSLSYLFQPTLCFSFHSVQCLWSEKSSQVQWWIEWREKGKNGSS